MRCGRSALVAGAASLETALGLPRCNLIEPRLNGRPCPAFASMAEISRIERRSRLRPGVASWQISVS